ncbi:MAG: hypothetical protein JSW58_02920, partial [Candidatus Latescibacterota bacterium]
MKKTLVIALCVLFAMSSVALAKNTQGKLADYKFVEVPAQSTAPELGGSMFQAAAANTVVIGWWQFDTSTGAPTPQGWTTIDITAQVSSYF